MTLEDGNCSSLGSRLKRLEDSILSTFFNNPFDFEIGDWIEEGIYYVINIPVSAHGSGEYPMMQSYEKIGGEYHSVSFDSIILKSDGEFKIRVLKNPDLRFSGRLIVDE